MTRNAPDSNLSPMTHPMEPSTPPTRNPPPPGAHPRPQRPPPPARKPRGADDLLVSAKVHVPYPKGVEVPTVTGVHRKKAGVVWVEYPNNPQLYEVARGVLFPTPQGAQEHLERVRKGKGKANPPPQPSG